LVQNALAVLSQSPLSALSSRMFFRAQPTIAKVNDLRTELNWLRASKPK
jgi:hypothetical protein